MKRFLQLLVTLLSIPLLTIIAVAEGTIYRLNDLGISIEIPSDVTVLTRDVNPDHDGLELTGMSAEDYINSLKETDTYLEAIGEDWGVMSIVMNDIGQGNMNELSESELQQVILGIEESSTAESICYMHDVYQHSQEKFLKFYWRTIRNLRVWDPGYVLQYYTVCNGKAINIYFDFRNGEIDEEKETMAESIIASIVFFDISDVESLDIGKMQSVSFAVYFSVLGILLLLYFSVKRKRKN